MFEFSIISLISVVRFFKPFSFFLLGMADQNFFGETSSASVPTCAQQFLKFDLLVYESHQNVVENKGFIENQASANLTELRQPFLPSKKNCTEDEGCIISFV